MNPLTEALFKRVWVSAWVVAACGTPIVYFFRQSHPWVAIIPVAGGLIIFALLEARRGTWDELLGILLSEQPDVAWQMESLVEQLRKIRTSVMLSFNPEQSKFGQLDLFERTVSKSRESDKGLMIVTSAHGEDFAILSWHRFEELLLNEIGPDSEKASDHALAKALDHVPPEIRTELLELLDKEVREIMKQDFRTSTVSLIAEATRRVALRLDAEASSAYAKRHGVTVTRHKRGRA
jgi:hypothetical protein